MSRIIVEAENVWDYFMIHKSELESALKLLAENSEFGIELYLSMEEYNNEKLPAIAVMADDEVIEEETAISERDCANLAEELYARYLTQDVVKNFLGDSEGSISERLDLIDERECELDFAIGDMLETLVPNLLEIEKNSDGLVEKLKDLVCEYLYKEYDISVYRPMYLEAEDGTEVFEEYPYPEMELEE